MKFRKSLVGMACLFAISFDVYAQSAPDVDITSTKNLKSNKALYDSANVQCFNSLDELRSLPNGYLVSGKGEGGLTTMTLNNITRYIIALAPVAQSGTLLTPTGSRYELTNSRGVAIESDGSITLLDLGEYSGCEAALAAGQSGLGAGTLASGGAAAGTGLSTGTTLAIGAGAAAVIAIIADDDDNNNDNVPLPPTADPAPVPDPDPAPPPSPAPASPS